MNKIEELKNQFLSKKSTEKNDNEFIITFSCDYKNNNNNYKVENTIVITVDDYKNKKELLEKIKKSILKDYFKTTNSNSISNLKIYNIY